MGFQVAGRCRPLSKFMEFLQDLILMALVALLSQYPLTDLTSQLPGTPYWTKLRNQQPVFYLFHNIIHLQANNKCFNHISFFITSSHVTSFIKPITSRLDLTLYSAVDKGLRVETSCITIF